MNRRIALALLGLLPMSPALAYDDGDAQFWAHASIERALAGTWKARLDSQFYFGDDMTEFYHQHAELTLSQRPVPWLELAANFRYVEEKKSGEWQKEYRPSGDVTPLWTLGGFKFADRNRMEYRMRESADDSWRYRNRFRVTAPWQWTRMKIQPYADDEIFVDFDARELNENRASVGLFAAPFKHLKIEVYYLLKSTLKNDEWTDANVFGTACRVVF